MHNNSPSVGLIDVGLIRVPDGCICRSCCAEFVSLLPRDEHEAAKQKQQLAALEDLEIVKVLRLASEVLNPLVGVAEEDLTDEQFDAMQALLGLADTVEILVEDTFERHCDSCVRSYAKDEYESDGCPNIRGRASWED